MDDLEHDLYTTELYGCVVGISRNEILCENMYLNNCAQVFS